MLPSRVWRDLFKKRPSAPLSRAGRCELDVLPIYMITTTILQGKITQASLIKRTSPINRIGSSSVNKALKVMDNLVPFYIDINWSIKKIKERKEKVIPQKTKTETSQVEQIFFFLTDFPIRRTNNWVSDQLEN